MAINSWKKHPTCLQLVYERTRLIGQWNFALCVAITWEFRITMNNISEFKKYFIDLKIVNKTTEQIIKYLEQNLLEEAQAEFYHDGDKIRQHRELYKRVINLLGCRLHQNKNCSHWLCK